MVQEPKQDGRDPGAGACGQEIWTAPLSWDLGLLGVWESRRDFQDLLYLTLPKLLTAGTRIDHRSEHEIPQGLPQSG